MMNNAQKSILQMARGAILERADYEMTRIIENIMDANTAPAAKRKLTLTLEFKPDAERQVIQVSCAAKSTLAPDQSRCYVAVCGGRGERGRDGAAGPRAGGYYGRGAGSTRSS